MNPIDDPTRHNWWPKIVALWDAGTIPRGQFSEVDVFHDDWCAINSGGCCNCDPDVRVRPRPAPEAAAVPLDPKAHPLLCKRRKDVPAGVVIPPGVATLRCAGCGAKVLASPASAALVRAGTVQPVCERCVPADTTFLPVMTTEQVAEMSAYVNQHERN